MTGQSLYPRDNCFIVAEMSGNHGGSFDLAKEIICAAKDAGADAIKLQTYTADTITLNSDLPDFRIPSENPWSSRNTLYDLYKKAFTPWEWHKELFEYATKLGLVIFSSPFDKSAVDLLENLNTPMYKIASPEITDIPLIKYVAETGKPVILSAGIATKQDIILAIKTVRDTGNENITLCQCTSAYPTPFSEMNLNAIGKVKEDFRCIPGLSDHSPGSVAPIVGVTLGAQFIEKHFITDRRIQTEDSFFSLDKDEFKQMVDDVRKAESSLGLDDFSLSKSKASSRWGRRSLYIAAPICKGEVFTAKHVRSVRPGLSLHPMHETDIIGKVAKRDYIYGSRIDEIEIL